MANASITVTVNVHVPVEKVWDIWTKPEHIIQWYHASDDWYAPRAQSDLRVGGQFAITMASRDNTQQFDFVGIYTQIDPLAAIYYTIGDGRHVETVFEQNGDATQVTQTFEIENVNSPEKQREGWQGILDNFKRYCEEVE